MVPRTAAPEVDSDPDAGTNGDLVNFNDTGDGHVALCAAASVVLEGDIDSADESDGKGFDGVEMEVPSNVANEVDPDPDPNADGDDSDLFEVVSVGGSEEPIPLRRVRNWRLYSYADLKNFYGDEADHWWSLAPAAADFDHSRNPSEASCIVADKVDG